MTFLIRIFFTTFVLAYWTNALEAFELIPRSSPASIPPIVVLDIPVAPSLSGGISGLQNTPAPQYAMIYKGKSIDIYEDGENGIYIQDIRLDGATLGAFFDFHHFDATTGEPLYTKFRPKTKITELSSPPLSFINGQFFDPRKKHTQFSFGFQYKNTVLTTGSDNRDERKNIFFYSSMSGARIVPYSLDVFLREKSDFALVNLDVSEKDRREMSIGRTYICLIDPDMSGYTRRMMTFVFRSTLESFALSILESWGCKAEYTSKLDASGSSVFGYQDQIAYGYTRKGSPDYRKIPQIIGFYDN